MPCDLSTLWGQQIVTNPDPELGLKGAMRLQGDPLLYPLERGL